MTLIQMTSVIQNWFQIQSSQRVPNKTEIAFWLNMGQGTLSGNTELIKTTATASTVASQANYTYPSGCLRLLRVRFHYSTTEKFILHPITTDELDIVNKEWETASAATTPSHYYIYNNEVCLYPKPIAIGTNNIIYEIVKAPADMTTDAAEPFDGIDRLQVYSPAIIDYAIWKLAPSALPAGVLQGTNILPHLKNNYFTEEERIRRAMSRGMSGKFDRLQLSGGGGRKKVSLPDEPYTP